MSPAPMFWDYMDHLCSFVTCLLKRTCTHVPVTCCVDSLEQCVLYKASANSIVIKFGGGAEKKAPPDQQQAGTWLESSTDLRAPVCWWSLYSRWWSVLMPGGTLTTGQAVDNWLSGTVELLVSAVLTAQWLVGWPGERHRLWLGTKFLHGAAGQSGTRWKSEPSSTRELESHAV